jgi:CubicO group peptidase (beta-lactamase class C family)
MMTSYALLNSGKPVYEGVYRAPDAKPNKPHAAFGKSGYGLGFNIMELYKTPVYYHSGGIAGFNSYLIHIPKNNITMVLLANTEDGIMPALKEILKVATEFEDQK